MVGRVEHLVAQVLSLSPNEQREFRSLLEERAVVASNLQHEESLKEHLVAIGLMREVKRPSRDDSTAAFEPIEITGKPLSEWIVEERE